MKTYYNVLNGFIASIFDLCETTEVLEPAGEIKSDCHIESQVCWNHGRWNSKGVIILLICLIGFQLDFGIRATYFVKIGKLFLVWLNI